MGYTKLIRYADIIELYQYEQDKRPSGRRRLRQPRLQLSDSCSVQGVDQDGPDSIRKRESSRQKRQDNARRVAMVFRRLVSANLGERPYPIFVSLTYPDIVTDIPRAYADFQAFIGRLRREHKDRVLKYVAVPEFQKRGSIHFHALIWGLDSGLVAASERRTRMVATAWGQGFADVIMTDGDLKISSYLAKYMVKSFTDNRFFGKKAYTASRNISRPVVEVDSLIEPLFMGDLVDVPDLSTADLLREKSYDTIWLGRGRYRMYRLLSDK